MRARLAGQLGEIRAGADDQAGTHGGSDPCAADGFLCHVPALGEHHPRRVLAPAVAGEQSPRLVI
ncbi:MAG TPA: hypothetical protein VIL34_23350 [Actinopolymorphaceae bacterium]